MKLFWKIGSTLVLATALVACGGGSDNEGTDQGGTTDQGPTTDLVSDQGTADVIENDVGTETGTDVAQTETTEETTEDVATETGTDVVNTDTSTDVTECTTAPTSWGPIGVLATLETPSTETDVQTKCYDFTGDGKGDSGLMKLASTVNPEIKKALDAGTIGVIFEFAGVTDFSNTASFTLGGLFGEPVDGSTTDYLIDSRSYGTDCKPLISFADAELVSGKLNAGPSDFILTIPVQGAPLTFTVEQTNLQATIASGNANGVEATDGVLSGVLTKAQIDKALALAKEACDAQDPQPEYCKYLTIAGTMLPALFDLRAKTDGTYEACGTGSDCAKAGNKADAMSVCMFYTIKAGKATGLVPDAE